MYTKWLSIVAILALFCCLQTVYGQETSTLSSSVNLEALTRQQKINRASILEGANDQIRVDAAIELLLSDDKFARQILIEALKQSDNVTAQAAVCKALAQSRSWLTNVRNKTDFLEPLFAILIAQPDTPAKLAAEAMVIFDYKQVGGRFEKIAVDNSADISAKLHAVYALKLRSDDQAETVVLIKLLDNKNKQVADAAAFALQDSLGIPVGTEPKVYEQIAKEVAGKSHDEYIRGRLLQQVVRVRQLEASIKRWQTLCISLTDSQYKGINEDNARASFLTERLSSDEPEIQLWAIKRVSEWRMGNKPLPPGFGPALLNLISAKDSTVRLETAKLLALTSYFAPAPALLKQLQAEKDEDVKIELFVALGEACNYASVSKSEVTVSEDIHKTTRSLAVKYLSDDDSKKAQRGAEVIGKLLIHNVVDKDEAQKYFSLLIQRYDREKADANSVLKSPLLDVMAGLCGQGAAYRVQASQTFEPLFVNALTAKDNSVREAAVSGIVKIDGPRALVMLTANNLKNDPSAAIRINLMDLAGKIGGPNDLTWLWAKINTNGDSDMAWRAMVEIFKRSDSSLLSEWISRFDANSAISLDRKTALLEIAEQKAGGENNVAILNAVRKRLADSYKEQGQFDKAAQYYGILAEAASGGGRDEALSNMLEVRLKAKQFDAAGQLVANRLLDKDLDANDVFVMKIGQFLDNNKADSVSLMKSLNGIGGVDGKAKWAHQLVLWRKLVEPNQPLIAPVQDTNSKTTAVLPPKKI